MNDFQQYQRTQIAELRPYVKGEPLVGISVSEVDIGCGSPRVGDMIARNPANHADQWLVAKAYFEQNFAPLEDSATIEALRRRVAELEDRQKTLVEAYIYDPRQWDDKESGGTATVLACLILERVREFIKNYGHDPAGNIEDALAAITAENAEIKQQVEALREDAEVGALVESVLPINHGDALRIRKVGTTTYVDHIDIDGPVGNVDGHGLSLLEALREAAKGEVE